MKKFIKALIIILVVVLAVGGTCFIFFKNLKIEEKSTESLIAYLYKADELKLEDVNYDGRFDTIIETNENLEDCLFTLSAYLINDNISVSDREIVKQLKEIENTLNVASSMIAEYNTKKTSEFYDKNLGRNDLYNTMCAYIVDYAGMINMINSQLDENPINKTADVKFDMIDLYCRVAMNDFAKTKVDESTKLVYVADSGNIDLFNTYFCVESSYVTFKPSSQQYPLINNSNCNKFTKYYSTCDKNSFAKSLKANVQNTTTIGNGSTNVELATYYFKLIYGI